MNKAVITSASTLIADVTNLGIGLLLLVAGVGQHSWLFLDIGPDSILLLNCGSVTVLLLRQLNITAHDVGPSGA
jgi:hypothetical protein